MRRTSHPLAGQTNVQGPNLYQTIGGTATCRKLSSAFNARVGRDPVLRPLFPGKTFTCAIEELAAFLVQFLGGRRRTRNASGG
jgi:hemoglobin